MKDRAKLTLGPLLFNWPAQSVQDFYARVADEAPIDSVHLGEIVCPKRTPFLADVLADAAERLARAGKEVVWSTQALLADARDVRAARTLVQQTDGLVEANDVTAMAMLAGRPHVVGPTVNVYSELTLAWMARNGAVRVCLPPELPAQAIAALAERVPGIELELLAYGRMPLALSVRCYHARAHGLHKDGCQFVCADDSDGMPLETLDGEPFLAVNGIQTLSHAVVDLSPAVDTLLGAGVRRFRLSPHRVDMPAVATTWRDLLDGRIEAGDGRDRIARLTTFADVADGYVHGRAGATRIARADGLAQ